MMCRRMLCGTGVFSGDAGTRWQIAAYHGATQAVSSTRSGCHSHGKTARTVMDCSCRWDNKVTTCSRTELATSRIGRDWLALIREVLWRQVVRTLEHIVIVTTALSCVVFQVILHWIMSRYLKSILGNGTILYIAYEFLLVFHSSYCLVLYHYRDKVRYWSKIAIFHTSPPFDVTIRGVSVPILE